jgi:hypothetical protein
MCRDAYSSRQAQELTGVALTSAMKFETCFYSNTCLVKKNTKKMRELPLVYAERSCETSNWRWRQHLTPQPGGFFLQKKASELTEKTLTDT